MGQGPRTGRGYGFCGMNFGRGPCGFYRYGMGCPFYQRAITKKEEKDILEDEAKNLEEELKAIREHIAQL